jgi:hypothetical protein
MVGNGAQPRRDVRGIQHLAQADRHIDAFSHQVEAGIRQQQVDIEFWIVTRERRQQRDDTDLAKRGGSSHTQNPTWSFRQLGSTLAGQDQFLDRSFDRVQVVPAGFGEFEATGAALKQSHSEFLFQRGDRTGYRGACHIVIAGNDRKAPAARDFDKELQIAQIHSCIMRTNVMRTSWFFAFLQLNTLAAWFNNMRA